MAKKKRPAPAAPQQAHTSVAPRIGSTRVMWAAFGLAVIVFYWTPLFDDQASIQWDMADVHYAQQRYFEQSLRSTGLPRWTPYEFSGFPFLADPQTGEWYPLHWPFFLFGITPRAMEWELALHAFLALGGMFLFARRFIGGTAPALLAAILYAFGGFFAGHSSHLGIFETAALLPWLLWAAMRAIESGGVRDVTLVGLISGAMVLAGHFQSSLYAFCALAICTAVARGRVERRAVTIAAALGIGFLLSAIQTLPGLVLTAESNRAVANYHTETAGALKPAALATLVMPNFYGVISGDYKGPADITQFYYYGGLVLIPLAALGLIRRKSILIPAFLVALPLWYALGPRTGLYDLLTLLPAFKSVRSPVHVWFVISFGLAILAGLGYTFITDRFQKPWFAAALIAFALGDLWYWNMSSNPLAYDRLSYAERYGNAFDASQSRLAAVKQHPFYRIWAPAATNAFGPLNSALESRTEVTYGYNPLELTRYGDYLNAAAENPKLMNGLAVTHKIVNGLPVENGEALDRVSVPATVTFAKDPDSAHALLASLDPAQSAVLEAAPRPLSAAGTRVQIVNYQDDFYRVRYAAPSECLLRIAVPYFPGWSAEIDGRPAEVLRVDWALSGVIVPAGNHNLTFRYRLPRFAAGAVISGLTWLACLAILLSPIFPGSVFHRPSR